MAKITKRAGQHLKTCALKIPPGANTRGPTAAGRFLRRKEHQYDRFWRFPL